MTRLVVTIDPEADTPRELRARLAAEFRAAILRAFLAGRLYIGQAEECWRVVPDPERA